MNEAVPQSEILNVPPERFANVGKNDIFESDVEESIEQPWHGDGEAESISSFKDLIDSYPDEPEAKILDVDGDERELEAGIIEGGMERIAWYKAAQYRDMTPYPGQWGIFYYKWAIPLVARGLFRAARRPLLMGLSSGPPLAYGEALAMSAEEIIIHESFHHATDRICRVVAAQHRLDVYGRYLNEVYWPLWPDDDLVEESLAQRRAHDFVKARHPSHVGALQACMRKLSGAYSRFDINPDEAFRTMEAQISGGAGWRIILDSYRRSSSTAFAEAIRSLEPASIDEILKKQCPIHAVKQKHVRPGFEYWMPSLKEVESFFDWKGLKYIETTDHKCYKSPDGVRVKIPNGHNKEIRLDELGRTLRKLGMTMSDFRRLRAESDCWKKRPAS